MGKVSSSGQEKSWQNLPSVEGKHNKSAICGSSYQTPSSAVYYFEQSYWMKYKEREAGM